MTLNFSEVFDDITKLGRKIPSEKYSVEGKVPIIDQGRDFIAGYSGDEFGAITDLPAIVFGDHTRIFKYVDVPFLLGADNVKVLKCKRDDLNVKYLYYRLCSADIPNTGYNRHFKWLKALSIDVIPYEEQTEAVNVLDKVCALIEKRQRQIDKLYTLVKSRFVETFGNAVTNNKQWAHSPVSSVAPVSPYKGRIEPVDGKYRLLNLDMIESQTGEILHEASVDLEEIGASTIAFNEDNVLYSKLRPYLNKVVDAKSEGYATSELVPLKPEQGILDKTFFVELLRSDAFVRYIMEKVAGAKMPRVSMEVFKNFEVIIPPIELQNEFAAFVDRTEKIKSTVKSSLEKLLTLKKALMQKYFG